MRRKRSWISSRKPMKRKQRLLLSLNEGDLDINTTNANYFVCKMLLISFCLMLPTN